MEDRAEPRMFSISAADILGPNGLFSRLVERWETRPGQVQMAEAIESVFRRGGHLVVEAPTGLGKTLGYLAAAVLSGRRVVISTHTKTLQDQIIEKDFPKLIEVLDSVGLCLRRSEVSEEDEFKNYTGSVKYQITDAIEYSVMKGRNNYLCLDKLKRKVGQRALFADVSDNTFLRIEDWSRVSERGDVAELDDVSQIGELWSQIDARAERCTGTRCSSYDSCYVKKMRDEANKAEIIIVNHYLLMADLALKAKATLEGRDTRFVEVIPEADLLVVDEAHAFESIASEHFGGSIKSSTLDTLCDELLGFIEANAFGSMELQGTDEVVNLVNKIQTIASAMWAQLDTRGRRQTLTANKVVLAGLKVETKKILSIGRKICIVANSWVDAESESISFVRLLEQWLDGLSFVMSADDPDYVYWYDSDGKQVNLGAAPVEVSSLLSQYLFPRYFATVWTSATLSVGDSDCAYFSSTIGVPRSQRKVLVLDSSFDFEEQAALFLPFDLPDPGQEDAEFRLESIAMELIHLVEGGALFLFTSRRVMSNMYNRLSRRLPYPCFVQGQMGKSKLIEQFIAKSPSVLFATQSFWEGVDIPGDPLRLVLIDKLPFDPPTDPLVQARAHRLESEGKSAFAYDQVPRAIIRLKQGFGRLIRTASDRGVVAILDGRVTRRSYGARFISALPPATRICEFDDLRQWFFGTDNKAGRVTEL